MKDHEIRDLVTEVTKVAKEFHDHQSLRDRVAHLLIPVLKKSLEDALGYTLIDVYSVHETVDERSTHGKLLGYFRDSDDAYYHAHGRGWYGSEASVNSHHALKIKDRVFITSTPFPIEFGPANLTDRERALAKLTPADKKALGL
jgi:hypothetical protein